MPAGDGGGGFGGRSNVLVERLLAVDEWNALYQAKVAELQEALYDSGVAQAVLDQWSAIVSSSGLVDAAKVTSDAARISQQF
jgi:spore coat protein CotH